jgi:hypothetical protein
MSLLQRIQVLPLDVLDKGYGNGCLIGNPADDRRDQAESGHLRCPPATLPGDDFVSLRLTESSGIQRPNHYGLNDTLGLDRIRQFLQGFGPHVEARLVASTLQEVERQLGQLLAIRSRCGDRRVSSGDRGCARGSLAQEVRQAPAQRGFFVDHGGGS